MRILFAGQMYTLRSLSNLKSSRLKVPSSRFDSAVEPDDDEGIEQVETDSWNNEQVHGGNVRRVVTQEGSPSLAGRPPSLDHVLGDARLRDLKPELEQFAVDARRAPKRISH